MKIATNEFTQKVFNEFIGKKRWIFNENIDNYSGDGTIDIITDTYYIILIQVRSKENKNIKKDVEPIKKMVEVEEIEGTSYFEIKYLANHFIEELTFKVGKISISKSHDFSIDMPMKKIFGADAKNLFEINEVLKILQNFRCFM